MERLRYAAHLQRQTDLPVLVTGGAQASQKTTVADLMKKVLTVEFFIDVRWVEGSAKNTFENATLSAEMLFREGFGAIYLVTHAWHMKRAEACFEAVGITVIPAFTRPTKKPTPLLRDFIPEPSRLCQVGWAIYEIFANLWYRVTYLRSHRFPQPNAD